VVVNLPPGGGGGESSLSDALLDFMTDGEAEVVGRATPASIAAAPSAAGGRGGLGSWIGKGVQVAKYIAGSGDAVEERSKELTSAP